MTLQYTKIHTVAGYTSGNLDIPFTFDYLDEQDVKIYKTDTSTTPLVQGAGWNFKTKKEITLISGGGTPALTIANGDKFVIQRETHLGSASVEFAPGSAIRAQDLNDNQKQALYAAQEREERTVTSTGDTFTGDVIFASNIVFEGATSNEHETTLTAKDPTADATITVPNLTGHIAILAADPNDTTISSTPAELNTLDGVDSDLAAADLNKINNVTNGTAAANKTVILDGNKDVSGIRNLSATKVSITTAPASATDVATKDYVDTQSLSGSVPTGLKGPAVDAITSARWQVRIVSTPQMIDEDINLGDLERTNKPCFHTLFGDPTVAAANTITVPSGSTLLILK